MNSCEVTAYITAIANIIYTQYSSEEIGLLAAILNQLGDTLATKLAFDEICGSNEKDENIEVL